MIGTEGLAGIPYNLVEAMWPQVERFLIKPVSLDDDYYLKDIKESCQKREMQLWIIGNENKIAGAGVSEIIIFPRSKVLSLKYAGGDDGKIDWPAIYKAMQRYAKEQGCTAVRGYGRLGWIRRLGLNAQPLAFFTIGVN